jgi:flagellar biosynthesis/type III secretory pathway protein FliH
MKLAEQALAEARGARSATILASPLDIDALTHHLEAAGIGPVVTLVRADPSLGRGSLRIVTNLGTLDAELHPQLERLARALRDTIDRG